jgi:hypothetical protein
MACKPLGSREEWVESTANPKGLKRLLVRLFFRRLSGRCSAPVVRSSKAGQLWARSRLRRVVYVGLAHLGVYPLVELFSAYTFIRSSLRNISKGLLDSDR